MPQAHGASTLCGIPSSRTRRLLRDETGVAAVLVPPVLVVGIAEPTFVVTLATALLFRGIGLALADGGQISGMPQDHAVFRVVGAFLLVEHTLPHLGAGACVSIDSSVAGFTADPGIRVNTLHPGPDTPFTRRIETASTGQPSQHAARAFDAMIPSAGTRHPRRSPAPCSTSRATTRAPPPEPPSRSTAA